MTILDAMRDPQLFGRWFAAPSWRAWAAFLGAMFALPLAGEDVDTFRQCTGRHDPPTEPCREAWAVVGRRGGKTQVAALLAVFLACFRDYRSVLGPGEVATVMVLASDRKQARVCLRYIRGLLAGTPMLAKMIVNETRETIELSNRVAIEIHTSTHKAVRGYSCAAVIADEVAFWPSDTESASSDVETVNALRPSLATTGGLLIGVSSPYARRGILWEQFSRHFGKEGSPVLVWQASSEIMNSGIDRREIERALEEDEPSARAEWFAEFRKDVESFVSREAVDAVVVPGRLELPPASEITYRAFVDPSGGSQDSMTLAICHHASGRVVLDCVRERRAPFSPADVVEEFAAVLQSYGVGSVTGDRYAGEWPRERFREQGVRYLLADKPKSDIYRDFLPLVTSGRAELLDEPRLLAQLTALERRTGRSGRDSIDHGPRGHDDVINSAAGAMVCASLHKPRQPLRAW